MSRSALPRAVAAGALRIDGREIAVRRLDDGQRLILEEPVVGLFASLPAALIQAARVRFLDIDGAECIGFKAASIVALATMRAQFAIFADSPADERRIGLECQAFVRLCDSVVRKVTGAEQAEAAS